MERPDIDSAYMTACQAFTGSGGWPMSIFMTWDKKPYNLLFLLLYAVQNGTPNVLEMVEKTLIQIRKGGIFDHVGYGFSRYSTDKSFLVPHFEKMLYDNALLIIAYASVYVVTKNQLYLDTAEKTAQYVLREMTVSGGGFYSAQDADSEGVNIPNLLKSNDLYADFGEEIQKLFDYRKKRSRLHLDDKILTSWNALMIAALSILYRVSRKEEYLWAAVNAQVFLEKNVSRGLCLLASWRKGKA